MEINKAAKKFEELILKLEDILIKEEYMEVARLAHASMINLKSYLPFNVGDRVLLNTDIDFDVNYGWRPWKNILYKGRIGTVDQIEIFGTEIRYLVIFDETSTEKIIFSFSEKDLRKL